MSASRPLPDVVDPAAAEFWKGAREHHVRLQRCPTCGYVRWPIAPRCPECLTVADEWADLRSTGTIWSSATYHRAFHPAFESEIPYTVVAVEMDDGPFILARWVGDAEKPAIGAAVEAKFVEVAPEVTLIAFGEAPQ